jgi:hypothetical protein
MLADRPAIAHGERVEGALDLAELLVFANERGDLRVLELLLERVLARPAGRVVLRGMAGEELGLGLEAPVEHLANAIRLLLVEPARPPLHLALLPIEPHDAGLEILQSRTGLLDLALERKQALGEQSLLPFPPAHDLLEARYERGGPQCVGHRHLR